MMGRRGERGSGISVLAAQHDDEDDDLQDVFTNHIYIYISLYIRCFNIHGIHVTANNSTNNNVESF